MSLQDLTLSRTGLSPNIHFFTEGFLYNMTQDNLYKLDMQSRLLGTVAFQTTS